MIRRHCLQAMLILVLSPLRAFAQAPQAKRIRGTVQSVGNDTVTVKPTDGAPVAVKLAPNWSVSTVAPLKLDEIKPNDFVGIGASGPVDHLVAIQVVVFPEFVARCRRRTLPVVGTAGELDDQCQCGRRRRNAGWGS